MPPVFFKPANTEALAHTMAAIASAAPTLPFLYYHIPSMTGVAFKDGMMGFAGHNSHRPSRRKCVFGLHSPQRGAKHRPSGNK